MAKIGKISLGDFPLLLAPMEDVTDKAFRELCKEQGADVVYSEFISADGLIRDARKSVVKLTFSEFERPIGIQLFGKDIPALCEAARIAESYKPDFIDLNFGCPVKKVVAKGGGAALLNNIPLMISIAEAVSHSVSIPVTAKTRLGWDEKNKPIVDIAERLQDAGIKALTIHGRTKAQLYSGTADWTLIGEVKNNTRMHIPVFGNGDVNSPQKAFEYKNRFGVDGIMIGRAAIGYPWIFRQVKSFLENGTVAPDPSLNDKISTCIKLLRGAIALGGPKTGLLKIRRHYSSVFRALPDFKPFRIRLLTANTEEEVIEVLKSIFNYYN